MSYYGNERLNRRDDIQHFGTKGMKWGYYDGKKNGKRTARADRYKNEMTENAIGAAKYNQLARDAEERENAAAIKKYTNKGLSPNQAVQIANHTKSIKYDVQANKYKERGQKATRNYNAASGLDYQLGYTVGQLSRNGKKQINKAKNWLSKKGRSIGKASKKQINKAKNWLKKNFDL